jgi:cobalamin biosynthesis Mg chelatase CobN
MKSDDEPSIVQLMMMMMMMMMTTGNDKAEDDDGILFYEENADDDHDDKADDKEANMETISLVNDGPQSSSIADIDNDDGWTDEDSTSDVGTGRSAKSFISEDQEIDVHSRASDLSRRISTENNHHHRHHDDDVDDDRSKRLNTTNVDITSVDHVDVESQTETPTAAGSKRSIFCYVAILVIIHVIIALVVVYFVVCYTMFMMN